MPNVYKYCYLRVAKVLFKVYATKLESSFPMIGYLNICSLTVSFGSAVFYYFDST